MQHSDITFWTDWPRTLRYVFFSLIVLFSACLFVFGVSYIQSPAPAIALQPIQEAHLQEVPVHRFQKGPFEFSVAGNNYILYERELGAPLEVHTEGPILFLCSLAIAVPLLLAIFTTLSQFYYLVTMGLFTLFVVSLRLEILEVGGLDSRALTIATLASYGLTSFYFVYFGKSVPFTTRVLMFFILTVAFALCVGLLSRVAHSFVQVATNAIPAAMVLIAILSLMVAHEIIAALIHLVTRGRQMSNSLRHFLALCLIYFANLGLAYAVRLQFVKWDILTVDFFFLLGLSTVLGIWGIRQRQKQFEGILEVEPYGVIGFLALALMAFSALTWFFQSGNDTATDTIGNIVIYSHLGFGIIFLLYIFSNFIAMLAQNMAVHKVLYNPNNMPYFTFRLGGLITTLAFLFYNSWEVPVQNAIASYHNATGDLYLMNGEAELAKVYYEKSVLYGFGNHHGNYALANLEGVRMNLRKERELYENAGAARPTEMSLLNWAQTLQTEQNNLRGLLALREAHQRMPTSGTISNSLGFLFRTTGSYDSAAIYFQQAAETGASAMAKANLAAMEAELRLPMGVDSLSLRELKSEFSSEQVNLLAHANALGARLPLLFQEPADTTLNRLEAAWLNNYLINQISSADTAQLARIERLVRKPSNTDLREPLLFALALSWHQVGDIARAFQLLEEVTINSTDQQGRYNNILAMWALEQNEPQRALGYAEFSVRQNFAGGRLAEAIARMELRQLGEAGAAWDSLLNKKDTTAIGLAVRMKTILEIPGDRIFLLSDEDKYTYLRYRVDLSDTLRFNNLLEAITEGDWKAKALLDRSRWLLAEDNAELAVQVLAKVNGLELTNPALFEELHLQELLLLAARADWNRLTTRMQEFKDWDKYPIENAFLQAALSNSSGDTTTAARLYRWVARANPFFEDGVVAAADYFRLHPGSDSFQPYRILVDGIQFHPGSLKIRKAFTLEAARRGFDDDVDESIRILQKRMTATAWLEFEKELQTARAQVNEQ